MTVHFSYYYYIIPSGLDITGVCGLWAVARILPGTSPHTYHVCVAVEDYTLLLLLLHCPLLAKHTWRLRAAEGISGASPHTYHVCVAVEDYTLYTLSFSYYYNTPSGLSTTGVCGPSIGPEPRIPETSPPYPG